MGLTSSSATCMSNYNRLLPSISLLSNTTILLSSFSLSSFGAAFTPFYRLTGPFAHPSAPITARTELWDTITRRGLLGNLAMGLIPMIAYGMLNAFVLMLEIIWVLSGRPKLSFMKGREVPAGVLG